MTTKTLTRGKAFAARVAEEWDPLPDGQALLIEVGRLIDRADWLQATIDGLDSPVIPSAQGPRVHPVIVEYRATFAALQRALASLGLDA